VPWEFGEEFRKSLWRVVATALPAIDASASLNRGSDDGIVFDEKTFPFHIKDSQPTSLLHFVPAMGRPTCRAKYKMKGQAVCIQ